MHHQRGDGLSGHAPVATTRSDRSQGRSRPWLRHALATALAVGTAATLAIVSATLAPDGVAAHEDGEVAVVLQPDHVVRGGTLTAIGADFFPGDTLDVRFVVGSNSRSIGTIVAGDDGHFTATIVIPADVPIGPAALDFVSGSGIVQRALFEVDPGDPIPASAPPAASEGEAEGATALSPLVLVALVIGAATVALAFAAVGRRQGH